MGTLERIKQKIKKFWYGLFITVFALTLSMDTKSGGMGMSPLISLFVWLILIFILTRVSIKLSMIIMVVAALFCMYKKDGPSQNLVALACIFIGIFAFFNHLQHRQEVDKGRRQLQSQGVGSCPHCNSTHFHYVQGYTDVSSDIEWNYDYGDDRYHRDNVIKTKRIEGYWKCDNCGRKFDNPYK